MFLDDYFISGISYLKGLWKARYDLPNAGAQGYRISQASASCLMKEAVDVLNTGKQSFSAEESTSPFGKGILAMFRKYVSHSN